MSKALFHSGVAARRLLPWAAALLLAGCSFSGPVSERGSVLPEPAAVSEAAQSYADGEAADAGAPAAMRCLYYERELFLSAMSSPRTYENGGRLAAGMIPHHLLASDMIAGFFTLAAQNPDGYDTVLLVSPSHFPENCRSDVVTSSSGWDTPYGTVNADSSAVNALLGNTDIAAEDNPSAVEADHGVAGLVPFVRYYLPNARVAVCLLSNKLDRNRLAAVCAEIADICSSGRVLLVASVDCSHYLSPEEASRRDAQTAEAIEAMDLRRILGFDDRNVDSPQSVAAFLETARGQGARLELLDRSSSAEKLPHALANPIYQDGITTYLVYAAWT